MEGVRKDIERNGWATLAPLITWACVILLPVLVPLATSNLTFLGFDNTLTISVFDVPKLATTGVLLFLGILSWSLSRSTSKLSLRVPAGARLGLVFMVLACVSTVFAVDVSTAIFGDYAYQRGLVTLLMCVGVYWLVSQTVTTPARARQLAWACIAGGMFVAAYALVQVAGVDPADWTGIEPWMLRRGIATLGNPDFVGGFVVFPLVLAVNEIVHGSTPLSRGIAALASLFMLFALAFSMTRGAWVGAFVGMSVVLLSPAGRRGGNRSVWAAAWLGVLVGLAAIVAGRLGLLDTVMIRLQDMVTFSPSWGSGRLHFWREALSLIVERPLLGAGPDSYRLVWYAARTPAEIAALGTGWYVADAHNILLTSMANVGIPATLALGSFVGYVLWDTRGVFQRRERIGSSPASMLAGWWAAVVGLCVYLSTGVDTVSTMLLLWIALAVLGSSHATRINIERAGLLRTVRTAAVVLAATLATVGVAMLLSSAYLMRSYTAQVGDDAIDSAMRASELSPWSYYARERYAHTLAEVALAANDTSLETTYEEAAKAYEGLLRDFPYDADGYATFALWLNQIAPRVGTSAYDRAVSVAIRGQRVHPTGVDLAIQRATAHMNLGEYGEACDALDAVWDLDMRRPNAGILYVRALMLADRPEQAESVAQTLREQFPDLTELEDILSGSDGT